MMASQQIQHKNKSVYEEPMLEIAYFPESDIILASGDIIIGEWDPQDPDGRDIGA